MKGWTNGNEDERIEGYIDERTQRRHMERERERDREREIYKRSERDRDKERDTETDTETYRDRQREGRTGEQNEIHCKVGERRMSCA